MGRIQVNEIRDFRLHSIFNTFFIGGIAVVAILSTSSYRMDFQNYSFRVPDSVYMLSPEFWIYIFVLMAMLSVYSFLFPHNAKKVVPITIAYVFIAFQTVQWPSVMGFDNFAHARDASLFEAGSKIGEHRYSTFPVSFYVLLALKNVFGTDLITTATVLSALIKALTFFTIYLISRHIIGGTIAYIPLCLFLLGNFEFNDYLQYSPQALGLLLYTFLVYLLLVKGSNGIEIKGIILVTFIILVLTHPFSSLLGVTTLIGLYIIRRVFNLKLMKQPSGQLVILAAVIFLGWQVFAAEDPLLYFSGNASSLLNDPAYSFNTILGKVEGQGRSIVDPILQSYRFGFYNALIVGSLLSMLLFRSMLNVKRLIGLSLGLLMLVPALVAASNPPHTVFLDRVVLFGVLPLSLLTGYLFYNLKDKHKLHSIALVVFITLLPVSLIGAHQYDYLNTVKYWEMNTMSFLSDHNQMSKFTTITLDGISFIIYKYYEVVKDDNIKVNLLTRTEHDPNTVFEATVLPGDLVVLSTRQKVDWYYNQGIHPSTWDNIEDNKFIKNDKYHRVYDSSYVKIYRLIPRLT